MHPSLCTLKLGSSFYGVLLAASQGYVSETWSLRKPKVTKLKSCKMWCGVEFFEHHEKLKSQIKIFYVEEGKISIVEANSF